MRSGIVHNDIKPTNILFGVGERRKLTFLVDYGMAVTSSCETKRVFRGNLAFAPSRKLRGNIEYDLRNDV
jgi:serine/threonine protein kinase